MDRRQAIWRPAWYGLDQTIVAGAHDTFIFVRPSSARRGSDLGSEPLLYWNWTLRSKTFSARATVESIHHPELGHIRGIIVYPLDLVVILPNDAVLTIDAEQQPGEISPSQTHLRCTDFAVEISGLTMLEEECIAALNAEDIETQEREWLRALGRAKLPMPYES